MMNRTLSILLLASVLAAGGACGSDNTTAPPTPIRPVPAGTVPSTASSSADSAPAVAANTVTLSEWAVKVPARVKAGTYTYAIANSGQTPHELLVFRSDLDIAAYPKTEGDITEDGAGITKISDGDNLEPGQTQQRTVELSLPGRYLFVCNLPGHFKQGMYAIVTVAP